MAKELIETKRGQDYLMKYRFVPDMDEKNMVVWHDKEAKHAKGKYNVQSVSTYVDVRDISGEVIHSHQVFIYPEDIKKMYDRLMELEGKEAIETPEDDLPF